MFCCRLDVVIRKTASEVKAFSEPCNTVEAWMRTSFRGHFEWSILLIFNKACCLKGCRKSELNTKRRGKSKSLRDEENKSLKRRGVIEPVIGQLMAHRLNRCLLKVSQGKVCMPCPAVLEWTFCGCRRWSAKRTLVFFAPAPCQWFGVTCSSMAPHVWALWALCRLVWNLTSKAAVD